MISLSAILTSTRKRPGKEKSAYTIIFWFLKSLESIGRAHSDSWQPFLSASDARTILQDQNGSALEKTCGELSWHAICADMIKIRQQLPPRLIVGQKSLQNEHIIYQNDNTQKEYTNNELVHNPTERTRRLAGTLCPYESQIPQQSERKNQTMIH